MATGVTWTTINGYQVPVYDQSVFKPWQRDIMGTVDAGDGSNYGVVGTEDAWGLDHNDAYSLYGADSPYNYWANWSLAKQGQGVGDAGGFGYNIDPSGFDGLLKIGDKEGLRVRYALKDGQYVPTLVGQEAWNSNRNNAGDFTALAMALGGTAAGMLGPTATGATSAGTTAGSTAGGSLLGELSAGGLTGGAAGTGGTFGGLGVGGSTSGLVAGSNALVPGSLAGSLGSGFSAGLGGLGSLTPSASTVSAWNSLAPSITGTTGGSAGMFDDLTGKISEALKSSGVSDSLLKELAPSLAKFGMGLYGKNQGDKYVNQLFDQEAQAAGDYRDAWTQYASGLEGLFAPTAGRYGAMRDNYLGAAEGMLGQLKDFNPQTFATDRYRAMQDLIAPQRATEQQSLMQDLYTKGGFGLTVNAPGSAGATVGVNPYVDTLVNRWGQQDKQMAYDSLAQGESYLDNLIRRQSGMFGQGVGADNIGVARGDRVLSANRDATTRYIEAMLRARAGRTGANAGSSAALTGGLIKNIPWDTIWDKLSGLFGSD